jgi:hypothetical protein
MTNLVSEAKAVKPHINSFSADLPTLATRAAIELDSLRRGRGDSAAASLKLSKLLRNSVETVELPQGKQLAALMDAGTLVIVARALRRTEKADEVKTTKNVWDLTRGIADMLEKAASQQSSGDIVELREFCLELARGTTSRYHALRINRICQPFQR